MNSFVNKPILTSQTIGERLRKAREGWGLSLNEVANKISVKYSYIESIEVGQYQDLPGDVYTLEYIKKYARFLHMDSIKAVESYLSERSVFFHEKRKPNIYLENRNFKKVLQSFFKVNLKIAINGIILAGVIGVFFYATTFIHGIFSAPVLEIMSPVKYQVINDSNITFQGRASGAEQVLINNEEIAISEFGDFQESFYLPKGINLLFVKAKNKYGRETTQYFTIVN
jgi:hypothetical protein